MSTTQSRSPRGTRNDAQPGTDDTNARRTPRTARGPQTQRDNQQQLGVNPEHKTETMRRRHRGTFP
jgi:hypothetical protein